MNFNSNQSWRGALVFGVLIVGLTPLGWSFDSGSTGADGAFSPTVDTTLNMPADGIFNFTVVTIPSGVTVKFNKNSVNTPVTFLVSGDVTIDGVIDIRGGDSTEVGAAGDGNQGDDGLPGIGGPGGFDGGRGGAPDSAIGSAGLGPGAGNQSRGVNTTSSASGTGCGGSGAGYLNAGSNSQTFTNSNSTSFCDTNNERALGGQSYGVETLLPLIGGSGGGGASAGDGFAGSGGGGGGGAILIAASGTVTVNGAINANGGRSGNSAGSLAGGTGGGGSGGAIRIIATTLTGEGAITANGGSIGTITPNSGGSQGGAGSPGRIRLEADIYTRTAATSPAFSFAVPQDIFVAGLPNLRITSVAGIAVPASPTGDEDVVLPETTPNPVTVEFATTGVPVGNTVDLTVTPSSGPVVTVTSPAITGTEAAGVTSVSVDIPDGPSVLSAEVSFTVTVAMNEQFDYSRFAKGEPVKRIRLSVDPTLGSLTTLITAAGNEYTWPSNDLAIN